MNSTFDFDHIDCNRHVASKSGHPRLRNDILSTFKIAAAQYYFWLRTGWRRCLEKAKVHQQTKDRRYNNSIHDWDITTSGLEKLTSAILQARSQPSDNGGGVVFLNFLRFSGFEIGVPIGCLGEISIFKIIIIWCRYSVVKARINMISLLSFINSIS